MPVTFSVAAHPANPVNLTDHTAKDILTNACRDQARYVEEVLQYGLSSEIQSVRARDATTIYPHILPDAQGNGFVNTVLDAYNQHRALVIRPDDVWLTILSQFNFFVNANAELLRANFVAHEGKKELIIYAEGTRYTVDFGAMSHQMVDLIEKNVVDPTLREWVLPRFSTTTENDTTVAAVLMMATLKKYFAYAFSSTTCGIPRVTLAGDKSDWVNILERLEKLKEYGIETIAWYHLLHPVICAFIAAFDAPQSNENVDFWQRVVFYEPPMSGPSAYTGWINAFTVFSKEGAWLGHRLDKTAVAQVSPDLLTAEEFWSTYSNFKLRVEPYHHMAHHEIPPAYAEVDVKLIDNGEEFDCIMMAGVVGTHISSSGDVLLSSTGQDDTVQPAAGWWICNKKQNVVSAQEQHDARVKERAARMEEKLREWELMQNKSEASRVMN
ncbi:hypothetical protein B0H12DRAFT_150285 [Mycena haematopus]|nr:hypothetical protein B0H12DRAFT_150285 [Mycena haematopus]